MCLLILVAMVIILPGLIILCVFFWYLSFFPFLSRVSILTRYIDIANSSVSLSVCPLRSGMR